MLVTMIDLELLKLLSNGQFHSGTALSSALGISRQSVSKHLQNLSVLGVDYCAVSGRGYRLNGPIQLLDEKAIREGLHPETEVLLEGVSLLASTTSTNEFLNQKAAEGVGAGQVVLAEYQSSGKGRRGNQWLSPIGSNIAMSILWRFQSGPSVVSGLSLAVGVALTRALNAFGLDTAALKWPNDLLVNRQKLGGILIEVSGEQGGPCHAVIGIGLNVMLSRSLIAQIDQPSTDLFSTLGASAVYGRNRLIGLILNALLPMLRDYERTGLMPYLIEWRDKDAFNGVEVFVKQGDTMIEGIGHGINDEGLLRLLDEHGTLRHFASGEVSLRSR